MKFLCLIYKNEAERDAIPDEQWEPLMQKGFDDADELRERGVSSAATRCSRCGPASPCGEAGRALVHRRAVRRDQGAAGRIRLIEAPDLEAAKEIVLALPSGRVGSVEMRPVWERDDLVARRVMAGGRARTRAVRR